MMMRMMTDPVMITHRAEPLGVTYAHGGWVRIARGYGMGRFRIKD